MTADLRALLDQVPPEEIPEVIAALSARMAAAWAKGNALAETTKPVQRGDVLLIRKEAAAILGVSEAWFKNRRGKLPFEVSLGHRTPRYSREGIERYIRSRNSRLSMKTT